MDELYTALHSRGAKLFLQVKMEKEEEEDETWLQRISGCLSGMMHHTPGMPCREAGAFF